jgi:hypothetical protein
VLRQQAGLGAFESGLPDRIHRMISAAELPSGNCCACCGRPTDHVANLRVQIESVWKRGPGQTRYMVLLAAVLISPFWWWRALFFESLFDENEQELGRDRFVETPLRVCEEDVRTLNKASRRKLQRLLRTVPIYDDLLSEYPSALVFRGPQEDRTQMARSA